MLSNHADTLTTVTRDMQLEEVLRPSQAWLHVSDFSDQKFARFANGFAYLQARRVSSGNLEQLHQLQSQLHVPPVTAKDVAEKLLGGKLVCTVGGQYQLRERSGELPTWISTAFENTHRLLDVKPPEDYRSPPLQWFRGLDLDFGAHDDQLIAHVEIDMQHPKPPVEEIPKPSK